MSDARRDDVRPQTGSGRNISLRDVVFTLYRRKWIVLAIALPIILVGGYSLFSQTGTYTATARVLVELSNVDMPRWNVNGRFIDYDRELSTLFNIAMSVPVAKMAAESLQDSLPVFRQLDPELEGLEERRNLEGYLLGGTNVSVVGESRILEFRFSAVHPRLALISVGAMRDAFVEYHVHGWKNMRAIAYYEEQIQVVRSHVDSLLAVRADILEETGYSEMREELRAEAGHLANAEYELVEAKSNRLVLQLEYDTLRAALSEDPRSFPMGEAQSRSNSLVYLRRLVGKHEDDLAVLMSVHTEDSVPVRRQKEQLRESLESLRREEEAYVESVRIQLEAAETRERMLAGLVSNFEQRRRRAPRAYHRISLIDAETNSLREVMESLQGKLGEVRIAQQADERVSSIVSLTEPELAEIFGGGKTVIYFGMLCFFAVALGVVAAFLLESLDHRIATPRDAEEHLNLPVYANISKPE